jgi:hypothetical protein
MNALRENLNSTEQQSGEYHAVSGWAIAAFVLGLLSASALAAPLLWSVPIAAAACAGIAMWRINRSRGEFIGWNIALLGLVLALMFGVAAPTRSLTRWIWMKQRAEIVAAEYIKLLQENQPYAAHQLMLPAAQRQKSADLVPAAYAADQKLLERYNGFLKQEPAKSLLEQGDKAKVDLLSSFMLPARDGADDIGLRYRISYPGDAGTKSFEAAIVLERSIDYQTQAEDWSVARSQQLEEPAE